MVNFHSYVKLPEGRYWFYTGSMTWFQGKWWLETSRKHPGKEETSRAWKTEICQANKQTLRAKEMTSSQDAMFRYSEPSHSQSPPCWATSHAWWCQPIPRWLSWAGHIPEPWGTTEPRLAIKADFSETHGFFFATDCWNPHLGSKSSTRRTECSSISLCWDITYTEKVWKSRSYPQKTLKP